MGLGKMMGLGKKGKIHVNTEKPTYYPGEFVNGNVFVDMKEQVDCDAIVVQCKGKEKVYWEETRTRTVNDGDGESHTETYEVHFDGSRELFKMKIPLSQGRTYIPPGQWVYPFQFQLPMELPASFKFKDSCWSGGENNKIKAKVEYSFKGTVDINGAFAKDLKGKSEIAILSVPLNTIPIGKMNKTETVMLCCCIPRGDVEMTVEADKGAYFCGETAQMHVQVDNRSSSSIEKMKAKFYRILTLRADGHSRRFKHLMSELHYDGCEGGEQLDQHQQLPLTGEFLPVTNSKHITCEYRIEIECAIPWAPDVELYIPIGLFEAPRAVWGYQPPAELVYYPPPPLE